MARRDYYKILGVGRDADQAAIKRAYRRLVLQYHPDRNRAPRSAAFLKIQEAYAVLSDSARRRQYDGTLRSATQLRKAGTRTGAPRSAAATTRQLFNVVVEGLGLSLGVSLGTRSISEPVRRPGSARPGAKTRRATGRNRQ